MKDTKAWRLFLAAAALSLAAASCGGAPEPETSGTAGPEETQTAETAGEEAASAETNAAESGAEESGRSEDESPEATAAGTPEQGDPETVFESFLTQTWGEEKGTGIFSYAFEPTWEAAAHPETAALSDQLIISHQQDLDLDGQTELVTVTLEGSAESGAGTNRLTVSVYEAEGGQAVLRDTVSLEECFAWYRMEYFVTGIRTGDSEVLLYLAADQDGYLFADGVTQQLKVCRYNGETLDFLLDETVSGSDDSWQDDWAQDLRDLGFSLDMPGDTMPWMIGTDELEPHFWVMCHGMADVKLEDSDAYRAACQESQQAQADYLVEHAKMQGFVKGGDGFVYLDGGWPDLFDTEETGLLPGSSSRYISQEELEALSNAELRLARNEIYARHGRIFDSPDLAEYFESQPWYQGTVPADQFDESVLNQWERANLELILQEEASRQDAT